MNNLIGQSFKNGKGEVITVVDVDSDVAILNDTQRIAISRLTDGKNFRPLVERVIENTVNNFNDSPMDIFDNTNRYGSLMNQLQTSVQNTGFIDDSNAGVAKIRVVEPTVDLTPKNQQQTQNIFIDDEARIEETRRKMIENQRLLNSKVIEQANKINKNNILDESELSVKLDDRDFGIREISPEGKVVEYHDIPTEREVSFKKKENPAYEMFRSVKRSVPFKMNIEISKLLPKKEFIQMWEESYEISMVEYLAEEFLRELMNNPESLKIQIINNINEQVFPKKREVKRAPKKPTPPKSQIIKEGKDPKPKK